MNNYEKIKNMTLDEMAETFQKKFCCEVCTLVFEPHKCPLYTCKEQRMNNLKRWLKQEAE